MQFVNLRLRARGRSRGQDTSEVLNQGARTRSTLHLPPGAERRVYFGPQDGWVDVPVLSRGSLGRTRSAGPLIVEEYDTTIVIPPGAAASLDEFGNVLVDVSSLL